MSARQEPLVCGADGFEYEVWFAREGYTPHYAEHLVDPLDKREKLLMFDPHTRFSAIVYDLEERRIEWEFRVPGSAVNNPHQGGMLLEDVPGFGRRGDVFCSDRDNNVVVVDRVRRVVAFRRRPTSWSVGWLHCVAKGLGSSLVATDYTANVVAKLRLPDLSEEWRIASIARPSKVSTIRGVGLAHDPSFGGHYLVASNTPRGGVFEIRDDGAIVWSVDPHTTMRGPWMGAPHSAFRLGRVECYGNATVVGGEAGGGILAINYYGEPIWGISSLYLREADGRSLYYFNPCGLAEVTHVFPTLDGRIGFVAWAGHNRSIVGVLRRLPERQQVGYVLAHNDGTADEWTGLRPVAADGWGEVLVGLKNTGPNPMEFRVIGYATPVLDLEVPAGGFTIVADKTVPPGGEEYVVLTGPLFFYQVLVKSASPGRRTTYQAFVVKRRG